MKQQPKKNLATALLLAGMVATAVPTAWADNTVQATNVAVVGQPDIQIKINQALVSVTDAKPYLDPANNRTMVPLRVISEQLGATVNWDEKTRTVDIAKDKKHIKVAIESKTANVDGTSVALDAPAVITNSRTFVPLRFISESMGAKVDWDQQARMVTIQTDTTSAPDTTTPETTTPGTNTNTTDTTQTPVTDTTTVTDTSNTTVTQPATNTTNNQGTTTTTPVTPNKAGGDLTIGEAVTFALANNSDLKSLKIDSDSADLNARLVNGSVKDLSVDVIDSLGLAQQKFANKAKADMAKRVNGYMLNATEKKIVLGAKKAYYDLLNAQADVDSKQQALTRSETQLKQASLAFSVGTRAKTDVLQAEAAVAGATAALASSQNNLMIVEMKLNQFIGADLGAHWNLKADKLDEETISTKLDQAIDLALKQRAEILQKQEEINMAKLNVELIDKYSSLTTYQGEMSKNEVTKSNLALEQTKRNVTIEVTQSYYNMQTGKEAVVANQKAVDATRENYRLTKLRFDNGLSTTLEVIQAQEDLSNRENQYQSAVYNYNLAVISFENSMGK